MPLAPSDVLKVLMVSEKSERYGDKMVHLWNECKRKLMVEAKGYQKNKVAYKVLSWALTVMLSAKAGVVGMLDVCR